MGAGSHLQASKGALTRARPCWHHDLELYGDWTSPNIGGWKQSLLENAVTPIQQYSYTTGKNSTDSAMIIDAMDILYSGQCDGFVLVSSDSDFTRLAIRLREAGRYVIGMGEKKTPESSSVLLLSYSRRPSGPVAGLRAPYS